MISIKDLLNKIKWDKSLDPDEFLIGYEDRIENTIIEIPYSAIKKVEKNFIVIEKDLEEVDIPLHRIRVVKQKGKIIWKR